MYTLQVKANDNETKMVVLKAEQFYKLDVFIPEVKVTKNYIDTDKVLDSLKRVLQIIKHRNKIIYRGVNKLNDSINKMLRELADLLAYALKNKTCVVFN